MDVTLNVRLFLFLLVFLLLVICNLLIAMEYVNGIGNRGEARINLNEGASSVKKEGRGEDGINEYSIIICQ